MASPKLLLPLSPQAAGIAPVWGFYLLAAPNVTSRKQSFLVDFGRPFSFRAAFVSQTLRLIRLVEVGALLP